MRPPAGPPPATVNGLVAGLTEAFGPGGLGLKAQSSRLPGNIQCPSPHLKERKEVNMLRKFGQLVSQRQITRTTSYEIKIKKTISPTNTNGTNGKEGRTNGPFLT